MAWGRIVAGSLLLEIVLIIVFVPLLSLYTVPALSPYIAAGCFVFGFLAGRWTVKKVRSNHLMHGLLVGILATAIYIALCAVSPDGLAAVVAGYGTVMFVLGNAMRIVGCMAGAGWRKGA
jgi:hypothetical protein